MTSMTRTIKKFKNFLFYALIAGNIFVRIWLLDYKTLWLDEAYSVIFGRSDWKTAIEYVLYLQGTFPGYWLVIHPLLKFLKNMPVEITLRAPSLIADVLAMLFFYKIVKKLLGEKEARLATLFYSFHPVLIWHSMDGRFYSIYLLLCILSIYFLINIKENGKGFILWTLFTGLIPYFHFYGYFFIFLLTMILYISFSTLIAETRGRLILKLFPLFLFMLPSLTLFFTQIQNPTIPNLILKGIQFKGMNFKDSLLFIVLSFFGNFHQEHLSFLAPSLLILLILIIFIFAKNKFKKLYIIILLFVLLIPPLVHYIIKIGFHSRYVIFSIPFFIFVTINLISGLQRVFKTLTILAFSINYLVVDYLTFTTTSARSFTREELKIIDNLPGNLLFVPGYFVYIFDAYNLLKNRDLFLCFPDFSNKKHLSIMHSPEYTNYIIFLIPEECSKLKEALENENKINLIFSPFLKTRELMGNCVTNATKSFKLIQVNELQSGITLIQMRK